MMKYFFNRTKNLSVLICLICVISVPFTSVFSQEDSIQKIHIRSKCKCPVICTDSVKGNCTVKVDLKFESNLFPDDLECFGFKLLKDNCVIACIRNTDSTDYFFYNLTYGIYTIEFFADGYYSKHGAFVLRHNDENKSDYFLVGKNQLPKYLQALIKERRRKRRTGN
ncbi:MAG: hypothetical protein IAF38_03360 [Bacteroidia bacterium]|nr:hypothetical protein [Bacteroidia bacterium]